VIVLATFQDGSWFTAALIVTFTFGPSILALLIAGFALPVFAYADRRWRA